MKFTTVKEKFLNAVLIAERISGKKESLPILSCILIQTNAQISVQATNLEAGIEITVPGEVQGKGNIAVPAQVLAQTIRAIGGDTLTCSAEEGNLLIESRGTKTLIKAIPHEEFPALPRTTEKPHISIARDKLIRGIQSVSYAASPSMIRPELGSVYVSTEGKQVTFVATDSFRLAEKTIQNSSGKSEAEVLVPLKHAMEIAHLLERTEREEVGLSVEESQLSLITDGVRYVSRIVEGNFPNYKEIIPKKATTEATVLKSDLAEVLRKARVFSGSDMHVGLHLYPKKKIFTMTARSADIGEMSDSIDAALSGEDLDINFHIGYLADCLPAIEGDSVTLAFSGAGKPLVVRGVSDSSFLYLVMPLNR